MRIRIAWQGASVMATLRDTPTTRAAAAVLPFAPRADTWGEEVNFSVPIPALERESDAQQVVDPGTVCFWVAGSFPALPFGPTPIPIGKRVPAPGGHQHLGNHYAQPSLFGTVRDGDDITVSLAEADC